MIRVEVTNLSTNQIGWAAEWPDEASADAWIAQQVSNNGWGAPGTYSIAKTDATADYNFRQSVLAAIKNQNTGSFIIATVSAINESKLAAGTMTMQTFQALLADQNVANIERSCWNGSLVTAKALIQTTNLSAYYTQDEINKILALFP